MTTRFQICLLLLLLAIHPLLAQNIELVKDGAAKAEIILPEKPNSVGVVPVTFFHIRNA